MIVKGNKCKRIPALSRTEGFFPEFQAINYESHITRTCSNQKIWAAGVIVDVREVTKSGGSVLSARAAASGPSQGSACDSEIGHLRDHRKYVLLYRNFQLRHGHDSIFWLRALIVPPSLLSFSPVFEYSWPSAGMTVRHLPWVWLFVTQIIVIATNSTFANDPTSGRFTPNTSLLLTERMIYQYNWVQALNWCVHFCLL